MFFEIVRASRDDTADILCLLADMHKENGRFALDTAKLAWAVWDGLANGQILLAKRGDTVMGSLCLVKDSEWYSSDPYVTDRWTYVYPAFRGGPAAKALVAAAKQWAGELPLYLGINSPVRIDAKIRFYKTLGFEQSAALMKEKS